VNPRQIQQWIGIGIRAAELADGICIVGEEATALYKRQQKRNQRRKRQGTVTTPPSSSQIPTEDPYVLFGLTCKATQAEITKRYRDLMRIYHPDAGGNDTMAKRLNIAYERLCKRR